MNLYEERRNGKGTKMELLKNRINSEGRVIGSNILKVDSF